MSRKSLDQIRREQHSLGLDGDSLPSSDPNDPRHRRSSASQVNSERRFNPDQFEVDAQGRVNMHLRANPRDQVAMMDFVESEDGIGSLALPLNVGFLAGPTLRSDGTADLALFRWVMPLDVDRSHPVTVTVRWVEHDNGSSTYQMDAEVYAYKLGTSVVGASTIATKSFSGTVNGTQGFENGGTFVVLPSGLVSAVALWMKLDWGSEPTTTDFLLSHVSVKYRTRFYHTHER